MKADGSLPLLGGTPKVAEEEVINKVNAAGL